MCYNIGHEMFYNDIGCEVIRVGEVLFAINVNVLPQVSAMDSCSQRPPYVHFKRKYHEYILYIITGGELYLQEGEKEYHLVENDIILLDPTRTHKGIKTSAFEFCYFHFLPGYGSNRYKEVNEEYSANSDEVIFPKYHHLGNVDITKICRELCERVPDISAAGGGLRRQKASALLHMLMLEITEDANNVECGRKNDSQSPLTSVRNLERYLRKHYMDSFDSEQLADSFGYNYDHLNRLFKKETEETIYRYLVRIRCEEARKLLKAGYYSNDEIAAKVGFAGGEHFSHVYKRTMGYSPRMETDSG